MLEYAADNHVALKCLSASVSCVPPFAPRPSFKVWRRIKLRLHYTQSLFLPRWRATKSSVLTAGIPYGPYPWPCSQAQHVLMDKCPERFRFFRSRFSAPCSPIVCAWAVLWENARLHTAAPVKVSWPHVWRESDRLKVVVSEETAEFDQYIKTQGWLNSKSRHNRKACLRVESLATIA